MKNIIIEGPRGTGKSTVTKILRENILNSTLINCTGFNEQGEEGIRKTMKYYNSWFNFFKDLKGTDMTFVHDRFYFSEMIYSTLYKDYNFEEEFQILNRRLKHSFDDVYLILLVINDAELLHNRLIRNKEALFGWVDENVTESFKQQYLYSHYLDRIPKNTGIKYHVIEVDDLTPEEVSQKIIDITT